MRTTEYPYYECSFFEFNKAQKAVVPYLDKDLNIVIALNTSVGKTALSECCMGYHLATSDSSKVVYVSPFKGISNEKYRDWEENKQFSKYGICLATGDSYAEREDYEKSRIIILTSESLDSKTRGYKYHTWLSDVACLVIDEAHLLGQLGRGDSIESALMRFTAINPLSRIILLSATMSNATELAKWVKQLNNKPTKCIQSDWRPTKIITYFNAYDDYEFETKNENKMEEVLKIAKEKLYGEKMIIFVHSKKLGSEIVKQLKRNGMMSSFHNASLSLDNRKKIEKMFDSYDYGMDILVSTSTLAAGVNIG